MAVQPMSIPALTAWDCIGLRHAITQGLAMICPRRHFELLDAHGLDNLDVEARYAIKRRR